MRHPLFRRSFNAVALALMSLLIVALVVIGINPSTATSATNSSTNTSTTTTTTSTPTSTTTTTSPTSTTTTTTTTPTSTTTTSTTTTTTLPRNTTPLWPTNASAAISIPQFSVAASSTRQPRVPIASLTKMMTTWLILHQLPLNYGQPGPCVTVDATDVARYHYDVDTDQSNAKIVLHERLCEGTLLKGLLVHSAGDYAELLLRLLNVSQATFVREMNSEAAAMGMAHTHYVDYSGISDGDRSTAHDQAVLASALMSSEAIVRRIVDLASVALPYVGKVGSYTPLIGVDGVVGVKSGYTTPAGGCDVLALAVPVGTTTVMVYAVVLGVHGANAINRAGLAALTLSRSLRSSYGRVRTATGVEIEWLGSPSYVVSPSTPANT